MGQLQYATHVKHNCTYEEVGEHSDLCGRSTSLQILHTADDGPTPHLQVFSLTLTIVEGGGIVWGWSGPQGDKICWPLSG